MTSVVASGKSGVAKESEVGRALNGWLSNLELIDIKSDCSPYARVKISAGYLHLDIDLHFDDEHTPSADAELNVREKIQKQIFRTRLRDSLDEDRFIVCVGFLDGE